MLNLSILPNPQNMGETIPYTVASWQELTKAALEQTWSPCQFLNNGRKQDDFKSAELLVLDVDNSPDDTDLQFIERFSSFKHIITTTRNHLKDKKTGLPSNARRYRVILQLERVITSLADYRSTYIDVLKRFPFCDSQTKDGARVFYPGQSLISIQEAGNKIPVVTTKVTSPNHAESRQKNMLDMGRLAKSTTDFLSNGAPEGEWNARLFKAAVDANEQGMTQAFFEAGLEATCEYGYLTPSDKATINSAFSREPRYEPRGLEDMENEESPQAPKAASANFLDKLDKAGDLLLRPDMFKGIPTGLDELDRRLGGGLMPHTLTGLSAPGKTGKTTLLTSLTASLAANGTKVGWLSLEMSPERHMMISILSIAAGLDLRTLAKNEDPVVPELIAAVKSGERYPWVSNIGYLDRMGQTPVEVIEDYIRSDYAERQTQVFFLDHVGYSLKDIQDFASHSALAKTLRKLTDDLPIHIIAVVQPRNLQYGERVSKGTLYGGAIWSQDLNQLLTLERKENDQMALYLTDSHNPMAITSTETGVLLQYDRSNCSLRE